MTQQPENMGRSGNGSGRVSSVPPNPQDPYRSFVVAASAGSGKTYQLSRRFLYLVGAGAAPGTILTVTFTKKAAGEMRARILAEAARLAVDKVAQAEFELQLQQFHRAAVALLAQGGGEGPAVRLGPPRTAADTAHLVLAASQLLKISTIDSLFLEWVSKFPYEASGGNLTHSGGRSGEAPLPSPFELLMPLAGRDLDAAAWRACCQLLGRGLRRRDPFTISLMAAVQGGAVRDLRGKLNALSRQDTYLWFSEVTQEPSSAGREGALLVHQWPGKSECGFAADDADSGEEGREAGPDCGEEGQEAGPDCGEGDDPAGYGEGDDPAALSDAALLASVAEPLTAIVKCLSDGDRRDVCLAAIAARDWQALISTEILTRADMKISGRYIRGAKRAALSGPIGDVEERLRAALDARCLKTLNQVGLAEYRLYGLYRRLRDHVKFAGGKLEFRDLVKGCHRLLAPPTATATGLGSAGVDLGAGVRFLLARTIHHVMLDEFQDTSRLQWSIFSELTEQLLAGSGAATEDSGLAPSVFIVGDAKQSIYGFREADPAVMREAQTSLTATKQVVEAPLNASYRTAQLVLDFVNAAFVLPPYAGAAVPQNALAHPTPNNAAPSGGAGRIEAFPLHTTATLPTNQGTAPGAAGDAVPVVANVGRVLIAPLLGDKPGRTNVKDDTDAAQTGADTGGASDTDTNADTSDSDVDLAAAEATLVATILKSCLSGEVPCPVYDKEGGTWRGLEPRDCALLYRSGTKAAQFEAALRQAGIACQREEEQGYFARPEIADAMALLRFLALPSDLVALATVLRSPLGGLPDTMLMEVLSHGLAGGAARPGLSSAAAADLSPPTPGATATRQSRTALILQALVEKDLRLATCLMELQASVGEVLPHALLSMALSRLGAFAAYTNPTFYPAAEASLAKRNLLRLIELCMQYENETAFGLPPLLERLELLAKQDEIGNAASPAQAVTLMTIHKSKGLEFPLIALIDTDRPWGKRDLYWVQSQSQTGETGIYYVGRQSEQPKADLGFAELQRTAENGVAAECQRLLYVALTRARQYLIITGHAVPRSQGLAATRMYPQLAAAMEALSGLSAPGGDRTTYELLGHPCQAWELLPPEIAHAATSGGARAREEADSTSPPQHLDPQLKGHEAAVPEAPPVPWMAAARAASGNDALLPRELIVRSPSRHGDKTARPANLHRGQGEQTSEPAAQPIRGPDARFAAGVGTFIHAGLEAWVKAFAGATPREEPRGSKVDLRLAAAWRAAVPPGGDYLKPKAWATLAAVQADPVLLGLLARATAVYTELPIVHLPAVPPESSRVLPGDIVIGTVDLLLHLAENKIMVIDYKTTEFTTAKPSDFALRSFCKERGYDAQLSDYQAAAEALYPGKEVAAAFYFTSLQRLLPGRGAS